MQHCRFPPTLTPRVIAVHADRAEPDANALVWVKKKTSQKRHKEDSYLKVRPPSPPLPSPPLPHLLPPPLPSLSPTHPPHPAPD